MTGAILLRPLDMLLDVLYDLPPDSPPAGLVYGSFTSEVSVS